MNRPINTFLKTKSQKLDYEMAFFSNPDVPEETCSADSYNYLVMIGVDPANMIMLTVGGIDFTFTPTQAKALGSKLLELASTSGAKAPTS
ncbi:hypothetical protein [Pseudomonas sp. RC3H12]|uniref:hypothetical protein n=1 Tax=Pseudomonas sp. RC3H12 TaxID=2834406 RepID=UPI001BDE07ED|nr:hypothetical protein [Pseudomonas sp. RC3H12]QWA30518.1 hypothetical protein KHO27_06480 [Pseudomonas sp. RC3H12]